MSDSGLTAGTATQQTRHALTEAGFSEKEFTVSSRTDEDVIVTTVEMNGWLPSETLSAVLPALSSLSDLIGKPSRDGRTFVVRRAAG